MFVAWNMLKPHYRCVVWQFPLFSCIICIYIYIHGVPYIYIYMYIPSHSHIFVRSFVRFHSEQNETPARRPADPLPSPRTSSEKHGQKNGKETWEYRGNIMANLRYPVKNIKQWDSPIDTKRLVRIKILPSKIALDMCLNLGPGWYPKRISWLMDVDSPSHMVRIDLCSPIPIIWFWWMLFIPVCRWVEGFPLMNCDNPQ